MIDSKSSAENPSSGMRFMNFKYTQLCDFIALLFLFLASIFLDISTAGIEICCYGAVLFFLIGGQYKKKYEFFRHSPFIIITLLLYAVILIWSVHSPAPWHDIKGDLSAYAKLFLIPVGLWAFQRHPKSIAPFLILLSSALFFVFLICTLKVHDFLPSSLSMWLGGNQLTSLNFGKAVGAAHIALSYFAAVLAFSWAWIFFQKFSSFTLGQKCGSFLLSAFSFYYLLFICDGRSGLPALVIPVLYLCVRYALTSKKFKSSLAIVMIFLGALALSYHFSSRLDQSIHQGTSDLQEYQTGNDTTSWGTRLGFWKNAAHLIHIHPIMGHGTGSYPTVYALLNTPPLLSTNPHQQYLFFWVENGLMGILFFLAFLYISGGYNTTISEITHPTKHSQTLKILLEGYVLAFAIGCLYNSWLHDVHEGFFFLLGVTGLYALNSQIQTQHHKVQ